MNNTIFSFLQDVDQKINGVEMTSVDFSVLWKTFEGLDIQILIEKLY